MAVSYANSHLSSWSNFDLGNTPLRGSALSRDVRGVGRIGFLVIEDVFDGNWLNTCRHDGIVNFKSLKHEHFEGIQSGLPWQNKSWSLSVLRHDFALLQN
jgi:hypothetical protein